MADNSTRLNATAATETIAADEIGGILYQRVKLEVGADGSATDIQPPDADGVAATRNLPAGGLLWNGASWDRQRGNTEGTLLSSAARTTTAFSSAMTNYNARGLLLHLSVTAASGTGGLTTKILASLNGAAVFYLAADATAVTSTGEYAYLLYPGASVAAPISSGLQKVWPIGLPRSWQVWVVHGDASSYTYALHYGLVL